MEKEKIKKIKLLIAFPLYSAPLYAQDTTGNIVAKSGKEAGYWIVMLSLLVIVSLILYRQLKNDRRKLTITRKNRISLNKEVESVK